MSLGHAAAAKKSLITAKPTVDENGIVRGFEIEVSYILNGYRSVYRHQIEDRELDDKPPEQFSKKELLGLCPTQQWDTIYDSQYESVVNAPAAPVRNRVDTFDVKTLTPDA